MLPGRSRTCYLCGPTDTSLHRIPNNDNVRLVEWARFCGVDSSNKLPTSARICTEHFDESQIIVEAKGKKLKRGANPTIHVPHKLKRLKSADNDRYERIVKEHGEKTLFRDTLKNRFQSFNISAPAPVDDSISNLQKDSCTKDDQQLSPMIGVNRRSSQSQEDSSSQDDQQRTPTLILDNEPMRVNIQQVTPLIDLSQETTTDNGDDKIRRPVNPVRVLRFIGDIRTPDLATPRRRRECLKVMRHQNRSTNLKMNALRRQNKRLQEKVKNLKHLLLDLQKKKMLSADRAADLLCDLPPIVSELALRRLHAKRQKYNSEIRRFALTLNFYSPKAYQYVRSKFGKLLPHSSTLRKWACSQNFSPGFSEETLKYLKNRNESEGKPMLCNLVLDEMSIRRQLILKNDKRYGFVDLGCGNSDASQPDDFDTDNASESSKMPPLAKKSLVLMLVSLNSNWKVPFAYFMVDYLNGKERSHLLSRAMELTEENGIIVRSVTFDGEVVNQTMVIELGVCLDVLSDKFKPHFKHPVKMNENVYVMLDPSHMIKNVRNSLGSTVTRNKAGALLYMSPFKDEHGRKISFHCLEKIVQLQNREGLRAANKLTDKHIKYKENIMNVNLAAQTLSHSTSTTLKYLEEKFPEQFAATGTADFAQNFNDAFEILNNNSAFGKTKYMRPIKLETIQDLESKAEPIIRYIKNLKNFNNVDIVASSKKCGFIGFIICLTNVFSLFRDLNFNYNLQYLLTKKLLQDHLENFFSCIRMKGGFNNNPNSHQFVCAYRLLVQHHQVSSSENANCAHTEDITILSVTVKKKEDNNTSLEADVEINLREKFNFSNIYIPSAFIHDVVHYLGGYVNYKILKIDFITCEICRTCIQDPTSCSRLIDIKSLGRLKTPSKDLFEILKKVEILLRDNESEMFTDSFVPIICGEVLRYVEQHKEMFGGLNHSAEHKKKIVNYSIPLYLKIRLYHEAEKVAVIDKYIRRSFTKLITLKNQ